MIDMDGLTTISGLERRWRGGDSLIRSEIALLFQALFRSREEVERLKSCLQTSQYTVKTQAEENDRLSALAATHLADQELLVGRERKRVARECAEIAANHQSQEFSDGCGTGKFIARTIREHYGVEG